MRAGRTILAVLVLGCVLLALAAPAAATPPETLVIEAVLDATGADSAAGTFTANGLPGLFPAIGEASEVFRMAAGTVHGVKTLATPQGTITIRFQARMTPTGEKTSRADGHFVIVSGTGAYEGVHGVGTSYAALDMETWHIVARYEGTAHFD